MKVLLIEPKASTSYPPLGLMKISRYHKILGDEVHYVVGKDKESSFKFWDKIYITSVFTYDYKVLKETVNFYSNNLFNFDNMLVGGIAATLLKEKLERETGVKVHSGLLNKHDERLKCAVYKSKQYDYLKDVGYTIDNLPPDYSLVMDSKKYDKIIGNSFFMFSTKGCPNNWGFCAVKTLEPDYVDYINIKDRIGILREEVGDRAGLLLLDNNIAASESFFKIINEIKNCGYGADEKMKYESKGKVLYRKRFVDFNQGVDLRLLDKKKMEALSTIAIDPLRLAFDHIGLSKQYVEKIELAIECGITKFSNYMLYNYKDRPEHLYERMEINTNIIKKHANNSIKIFSFPMRYSPVGKVHRNYVGSKWTKRQIRAVQLILQATHGIVSHSLSQYRGGQGYFYRAFGCDVNDFMKILVMPFHYIINRDLFEIERENVNIWRKEYDALSEQEKKDLLTIVSEGINKKLTTEQLGYLPILSHYTNEHTQVIQT